MMGMMGWYGGMNPFGPAVLTLVLLAAIAVVTWLVVRRSPDGTDAGPYETPEEVLDHRFARGDIDLETYQVHRSALQSRPSPTGLRTRG